MGFSERKQKTVSCFEGWQKVYELQDLNILL